MKTLLTIISFIFIVSCSSPYNFSGSYSLIKGNSCKGRPDSAAFVTIDGKADGSYYARLHSQFSSNLGWPVVSSPAKLSSDGSITLVFFKERKVSFFQNTPSILMEIKLREKNRNHVYIEEWIMELSANNQLITQDILKPPTQRSPLEDVQKFYSNKSGKNGLCLKRKK